MKIALIIHSYPGANDAVKRHWEHYKKSGMDIFGVDRIGGLGRWPDAVPVKEIGEDSYICGDNLPRRMVDTFDWFITDEIFKNYDAAMVIEYDAIFIRPPPDLPDAVHVAATRGGGGVANSTTQTETFWHTPWVLTKCAAEDFVAKGRELLSAGIYENGSPDFFFGLVIQHLGVPVHNLEVTQSNAGTFSRNSLDIACDLGLATEFARAGRVWYIHGIKDKAMLDAVLS